MDPNLFLSLIALSAFLGSLVSGALGWLSSGQPLVARTYMSTVLRGVLSAIALAAAYTLDTNPSVIFIPLATAFLSGAGIDALLRRGSGAITTSGTSTTTTTKT